MPNPLTFFKTAEEAVEYLVELDTDQFKDARHQLLAKPWERAIFCRDFIIIEHTDKHCELFRNIPETRKYVRRLLQLEMFK